MSFPTNIPDIEQLISAIQPEKYGRTRNFKNGAITRLSPYISRGVISTRKVYEHVRATGAEWYKAEKLIQELAWRDYWQQVWIAKEHAIFSDLKRAQPQVGNHQLPKAILKAATGIHAVDDAIYELYQTGYMHNHMRMYVASICCNIAKSHWLEPARWMYSQLLDGDLASNHLSWQWVAGSNANKKYYANQDNINKYWSSQQKGTFLDVSYDQFESLPIPDQLQELMRLEASSVLPEDQPVNLVPGKTTLVYNYYNLDPYWHQGKDVQRILLLEPSLFEQYPVAQHCIDFVLALAGNISGIQVLVGSFDELSNHVHPEHLIYKEHPLNAHYQGQQESRDWMTTVTGYYPSFFAFWKKAKKELKW